MQRPVPLPEQQHDKVGLSHPGKAHLLGAFRRGTEVLGRDHGMTEAFGRSANANLFNEQWHRDPTALPC